MTTHRTKPRFRWHVLAGYLAINLVVFSVDPYDSPWHYKSQDPIPVQVVATTDSDMTIDQIVRVLDSIDLAYEAREPNGSDKLRLAGIQLIQIALLPSNIALGIKGFFGYLGPANSQQQAFTISVKRRYNHLARLALGKGMNKDGFLFQEEPSLSKKNGTPFAALR